MASELDIKGLMNMLSKFGSSEDEDNPYSTGVMDSFIKKLGIGENAELDNPAERDFLKSIMEAEGMKVDPTAKETTSNPIPKTNYMPSKDYEFDVDGNTQGYTFTGDAPLSPEAIQRMRDIQGITADGQMLPNTTNLGIGEGIGAAAETNFLENSFAGTGEANMDVDRASFNTNFANLTPEEQANVTQLMANMTPEQKKAFALGMTGKEGAGRLGGYEVNNQNRLAY
jgi:hypothetical protein|tara:strand:+ start:246 stop:926 length:681 start_codon:yes stop_codon:yes gene_type:complete